MVKVHPDARLETYASVAIAGYRQPRFEVRKHQDGLKDLDGG